MQIRIFLVTLQFAMLSVQPTKALADSWLDAIKSLHPYATVKFTDDSNLLRTSDPESDRYSTLEAGLDTQLRISRQRIIIDGTIYRNRYDRFDQLDYTGGDARVQWKWLRGKLWEGDLGYSYDRRLRDLANELVPTRDLRDRHEVFGSARRWLTTRWRLGAETDWTDISFSESDDLNKSILGFGASLDYVSLARNEVGIAAAYSGARFANRDDQDYEDLSIGPTLDWQLTGKTRFKGDVAYKTRDFDVFSREDFAGVVGRLRLTWKPTGKISVKTSVWRELSNLNDEITDYAIVDGARLEPIWDITTKTSLRALASFERRDFQGDALQEDDNEQVFSDRVDDVSAFGLWLEWNARRNISLSLGFRSETRASTRELRDYDYQYVEASFSASL